MEVDKAQSEIKYIVRDLLSHDPIAFNSTINARFASGCAYHGHGLEIKGASNVKHAAWLFNLVDSGKAAKVQDDDIKWDQSTTTAHVKATRIIRPRFMPLFQYAVPTEVVLKFNPQSGNGKVKEDGLLYCTLFEDHWPLDSIFQSLPLIGALYRSLWIPLATFLVLQLSNIVFNLFANLRTWDRTMVEPTVKNVETKIPKGVKSGFERGMTLADGLGSRTIEVISTVAYGPLYAVEKGAQALTKLANIFLPRALQLPYPSVFDKEDKRSSVREQKKAEKPQLASKVPEIRLSPSDEEKEKATPATATNGASLSNKQPSTSNGKFKQTSYNDEPKHAKVVVGASADGQEQAKEIDVVTHQVKEQPSDETGKSLYQQIKSEGGLEPVQDDNEDGNSSATSSPKFGNGEESRKKSGKGKKAKNGKK